MKNTVIYIFILFFSLLDVFFNFNLQTKLALIFLIFLILYLIYKNKIPKHFNKIIFLLVFYFIFYFSLKLFKYDLHYALKSVYLLIKIFACPLIIYFIIYNKNNSNDKGKSILLIVLSLITILKMFLTNTISLEELIFLLMCVILIYPDNKVIKTSIILLTIILAFLFKHNILLIYAIILIIISIISLIKKHESLKNYFVLIILLLLSSSILFYINYKGNLEKPLYNVNNNYEFPKHNYEVEAINTHQDIIPVIKTSNIKDILFGFPYHLINLNESIITVFLHLGIIGSIIYLIIIYLLIKKLFISKNLYLIALITLLFMSNLIYLPFYALILGIIINFKYLKEFETEILFTHKNILILIIVIILSLVIALILKPNNSNINSFDVNLELSDKLKALNDYDLKMLEKEHNKDNNVEEDIYYYHLLKNSKVLASIIYSTRKINNVILNFLTINNKDNNLKINLKLSDEKLTLLKDFEPFNETREYSTVVGYDKKLLPIGYYKNDNEEMIIGRSISYRTLKSVYDNNNESVIYDLINQENDLEDNKKRILVNSNTSVDTYIISSKDKLFDSEDALNTFINLINKNSSWLTYKGNLYKVQYSIDPFTREGYSKILGKLIEEDFYNASNNNKSIIFKALSDNAFYILYNYTPKYGKDGLWLTEYTSTWLNKDYGTKAFYIDTRYNETIGYLLLTKYEKEKEEKYLNAFIEYADFIYHNWQNKIGVYKVNEILLMEDYFASSNTTYTHSSFNHQLALINYLFKAYEITNKKIYYETAKDMLENILKFEDKWIRDNGDLWYQVNKNGVFSGTDYEIVTLEDLIFTQNYIWKFDKIINEQIMKYLDSKVKYLQANNKNVPTNDIKSIKDFKEKLNRK